MMNRITGFDVIAIVGCLKGVQTDQLNELVMGEEDLASFNPNALRQIVRRLKDLEEGYHPYPTMMGGETPRFDFSAEYAHAEELIEMLEKDD